MIKLIMKHKPDVNNMDFHGNTILIRAIGASNLDLFKMMVSSKWKFGICELFRKSWIFHQTFFISCIVEPNICVRQ